MFPTSVYSRSTLEINLHSGNFLVHATRSVSWPVSNMNHCFVSYVGKMQSKCQTVTQICDIKDGNEMQKVSEL